MSTTTVTKRDMNERPIAVPSLEHRRIYGFLDATSRKALAFLLQVDTTQSGNSSRFSRSVRPGALGQHMRGIQQAHGDRESVVEGLRQMRILAVHRIVYEASEREGWRLTPTGYLVGLCATPQDPT